MVEPGSLDLSDEEAKVLANYLLNGGFLWLDDFWGEHEWDNVAAEMKKVFPDRDFVELPLTNGLYHCVFEIKAKGQVPNIGLGTDSQFDPEHRTWERADAKVVHHRAIFDDKGRLMVLPPTTPTTATAGNGKARTTTISTTSPKRSPIRSPSTCSFTS